MWCFRVWEGGRKGGRKGGFGGGRVEEKKSFHDKISVFPHHFPFLKPMPRKFQRLKDFLFIFSAFFMKMSVWLFGLLQRKVCFLISV